MGWTGTRMGGAGRMLAGALLLALPGGCWFSDAPLIDAGSASDFPYTGTYADPESGTSKVVIAPGPDRSYDLIAPDSTVNVYFLDLGRGWYLYQMTDQSAKDEPVLGSPPASEPPDSGDRGRLILYNMMKYADGSLLMYNPDCDEDIAAIEGIEDEGNGGCRISSLSALRKAGRRFIRAVEAGTMVKEPDVLVPWTGD